MSVNYAQHVQTKATPQTEQIRSKQQVQNEAGGYVFKVDCWTRLHRFLILGNEDGCYYATEKMRTIETVDCIDEAVAVDYVRAVDMIVEISTTGRAPKNDPAIFALAYIAGHRGGNSAGYALSQLNKVCRIGTHLFDFCTNVQQFRGWGRGLREAVAKWYTSRSPQSLAMQVTKYQQRNGWSHRDVLRKAHPQAIGETNEVLQYVTQRNNWLLDRVPQNRYGTTLHSKVTSFLTAVEEAEITESESHIVELIGKYGLVREHIPTNWLNNKNVWAALLDKMPLHAMVRNLGKMTAIGLLEPFSIHARAVADALSNAESIKSARLHPLNTLIAQRQYIKGCGDKGNLSWSPVSQITSALERAFYLGFDAIEPTGKNFLLGVDVSGSMFFAKCAGAPITCCEAAAVMAMVAVRTEPHTHVLGFCDRPVALGITADDTLQTAADKAQRENWGGTDCAALLIHASRKKWEVDVFCVYTDGQTWAGPQHVCQALEEYRQKSGRPAKLAAFQLEGYSMSIADPSDAGMMDFSGFDTAAPSILADFVLQE